MTHLPRYDLERMVAGEAPNEVLRHVQSCEVCSAYVAELQKTSDELMRRCPPELFVRRLIESTTAAPKHLSNQRRRLRYALVAGLTTACVLIFVLWRLASVPISSDHSSLPADQHDELRWMGPRFVVNTIIRRGGRIMHLSDPSLKPGDEARYEITPSPNSTGWGAVVAIEDGEIIPLLPTAGAAYRIEEKTVLPGSVAIDKQGGDLEIVVFVRPDPFDVSTLVSEWRARTHESGVSTMRGILVRQKVVW
jgi:hypothetical protein